MKTKVLIALLIVLTNVGCSKNDVFFQYQNIESKGWNKDSLYTFDITVQDTLTAYNLYVNIRNKGEYPYQNLWLFLNKTNPDSTQMKDSIECYLADQRGKWLGFGVGSIKEMSVLYQQNIRFKSPGIYRYKIVHGMRDTILIGINDIGMRLEKVVKQ
jgi:gliding motility-associated lipoprotein GldH